MILAVSHMLQDSNLIDSINGPSHCKRSFSSAIKMNSGCLGDTFHLTADAPSLIEKGFSASFSARASPSVERSTPFRLEINTSAVYHS